MKYRPKNINEIIFENTELEHLINTWITNSSIPGNVIFYGKPGLGKTTTALILKKAIIKNQLDFKEMESRTVQEIDSEIIPFVKKEPKVSNHKIVLIEEIDKLSPQAVGTLKTKILEENQSHTIFIATTNKISVIDKALLQRFTFKIPFLGRNSDKIFDRLNYILKSESAIYNENELKDYVSMNIDIGIRELINQLNMTYISNNNTIDFNNIKKMSNIEEKIISLTIQIIDILFKINKTDKYKCFITPYQSEIALQWEQITTSITNNIDINYDNIYNRLYESDTINKFNPFKKIIINYHENMETKKYQHAHFLSCITDLIVCVSEIFSGSI